MKFTKILKTRYVPGWIILLIDVSLTFFSLIISYLLRFNFILPDITNNISVGNVLITLFIYTAGFICLGSHKQIIRHSTFHGISRLLLVVIIVNAVIIVLNKLYYSINNDQII